MKLKFLLFFVYLFMQVSLIAQDSTKNWKTGGTGVITGSQVSLTNWAAGGENSLSLTGALNVFANYKKGTLAWDNTLDFGYGILKQGEKNMIKSDDKIAFASKLGRKASDKWYYTFLFAFNSQFAKGYNYPNDSDVISKFMAPAYLLYSLGMDFKPSDKFTAYLSPLSGKTTIVNDQLLSNAGAFGVDPGKMIRMELGGYAKFGVKKEIMKNVKLESTLDLFSNYLKNPQNIDVNWAALVNMKVNKILTVNLSTNLIYDDDIKIVVDENTGKTGPRTQFKEVFGLGLAFKF